MNNGIAGFQVWSDGSCLGNPGAGGYAAIAFDPDGKELAVVTGREKRSTNQRMEMVAAAEGLAQLPLGVEVTVCTDSKYVVDGMTSWIFGWKRRGWKKADGEPVKNLELWQRLDREVSNRKVKWMHVRGHVGIELNERCDKLANEQARLAKAGE
ncbi:ribonuclease HI [Mesorhizobium sp. SP-1A]|uniref:ribonuclease HI n=1 Tax=Mesorhizobium sp. SP-1A TaxID=3077840 RepID=UPI0028F735D1|nr:ribonuclease HI [Mesorhizobium sp. SP-1A]